MKKSWNEPPIESPIPFHSGSNGEFLPRPPSEKERKAEEMFLRIVDDNSRKLGISRRDFVQSISASAAALLVINQVSGCHGGSYNVDAGMTFDPGPCVSLSGNEFIFDIQTHHVNPMGTWRQTQSILIEYLRAFSGANCTGVDDPLDCYNVDHYIREMFVNSDTTMAVLSALPAYSGMNPLEIDEMHKTQELVQKLAQSERFLIHAVIFPDQPGEIDKMPMLKETYPVAAWKIYTPKGNWKLNDPKIGLPFIEKARSLGIKLIAAHKGLPILGLDPAFASPDDVGIVAKMYPDVNFLIYHSGFDTTMTEGPYNPMKPVGTDRLIKSLEDNGIAPNSNVYAELGSTWKYTMGTPDAAAHVLGKLLKHVGEDRVVWGTDSLFYGGPQDQITGFRAFQISQMFQDMYGYPALTQAIKDKIFGLNAAAAYGVDVSKMRCKIKDQTDFSKIGLNLDVPKNPPFKKYGPQTRREMFAFLRAHGGFAG